VTSKIAIRRELRDISIGYSFFNDSSLLMMKTPADQIYGLTTSCLAQFGSLQTLAFEVERSTMLFYKKEHTILQSRLQSFRSEARARRSLARYHNNIALGKKVENTINRFREVAKIEPNFKPRVLEFKLRAGLENNHPDIMPIRIKLIPEADFAEDLSEFFWYRKSGEGKR